MRLLPDNMFLFLRKPFLMGLKHELLKNTKKNK